MACTRATAALKGQRALARARHGKNFHARKVAVSAAAVEVKVPTSHKDSSRDALAQLATSGINRAPLLLTQVFRCGDRC